MHGLLVAAGLAVAGVLLSSCSAADQVEVSAAASPYTESDGPLGVALEKERAECRIRLILESDLSDEVVAAVKRGEPPSAKNAKDAEVLRMLADEIARECLPVEK